MTREQLAARIKAAAYLEGDFVLRSGKRSRYYLDKYLFETQPDILRALGEEFARRIPPGVTRLAGPELGGVALAASASLASGLPFILVRNAKKDYGTAKQYEGRLEKGDRVLITEDIATSGGQSIEAAKGLVAAGAVVEKIVVVIDRLEGARAAVEAAGFGFESLFTTAELGIAPPQ